MLDKIAPLYMAEFFGKERGRKVVRPPLEVIREEYGVVGNEQIVKVSLREYERSDFYNLVLRPLGYGTLLRLTLRNFDRPTAFLHLHRLLKGPEFSAEDRERFALLEPFLAHALLRKAEDDAHRILFIDSGEQGMIIADRDGRPVRFHPARAA